MKIHFLCNDGSQLGVTLKTLYGDDPIQPGVGGAEYALLTMCEELHKRGHEVVLYNNPRYLDGSPFEQRYIKDFDPTEDRDVLVVFRSPNVRSIIAKGYKVWWSCDQYTVGSFKNFSKMVNKIVVISPFHQKHFADEYGITDTIVTDLPVRVQDYAAETFTKHKHRFLWTTVPDRGLDYLWRLWPQIKRDIPDATLVITSDYRLWGNHTANNDQYRVRWAAWNDITFLGAINRRQLVQQQLNAGMMVYNSGYDELFCLAVAEAQVAGVYTITNSKGALATTNMGTIIGWPNGTDPRGDKFFINEIKKTLSDPDFNTHRMELQGKAWDRFHPDRIASFWESEILNENSCSNRSE